MNCSISWLHISDIHMCVRDAWSQDVVLRAMCDNISLQSKEGVTIDFILATGDLAFSGATEEYELTKPFFDALSKASGVGKERIFCIPGNHDINRTRQKLCFLGARQFFQSVNQVDSLLHPGEELETLLKRQENYRAFQSSYFTGQERIRTSDGLGYISTLTINDVRLAIVGLDSAWLAEGGEGDHGKLLIGERQVINALSLANDFEPHLVIAMAHHPLHVLKEFDRLPIQNRIEQGCHFFHCGHLHEPEARQVGHMRSSCLTLAAGASFETRLSQNSYSLVTLDLLQAQRTVTTIQYRPTSGAFTYTSSESYPIEIAQAGTCTVSELALAMKAYRPSLSMFAHYLSALLLEAKSEIPIPNQTEHFFGSFALLQTQPNSELKHKTTAFMAFRNLLRVHYKRIPLGDIFARYGEMVAGYGTMLEGMANLHPDLKARLTQMEREAGMLAATEPQQSSYTIELFSQLAKEYEWSLLRDQAERHLDSPDRVVAIQAKRMLALSLAQSEEPVDKDTAIELYRSLIQEVDAAVSDFGNLATLFVDAGNIEEAKTTVFDGIRKFPTRAGDSFLAIGRRIVEMTGDRELRKQLEAAI
jgi:3',5'-cyclic AMP phosphodiesterase CpdA